MTQMLQPKPESEDEFKSLPQPKLDSEDEFGSMDLLDPAGLAEMDVVVVARLRQSLTRPTMPPDTCPSAMPSPDKKYHLCNYSLLTSDVTAWLGLQAVAPGWLGVA